MIIIGLTGSLGTGKSTVAQIFKEAGVVVIDADLIVHELLKNNKTVLSEIKRIFGEAVFVQKQIDRKKLGQVVFGDVKKLKLLTAILHPIALKEVLSQINQVKNNTNVRMVVVDAPLLIEAKWHLWVDYLIVVKSSRELQFKRLWQQRKMSKAEILRRLKVQLPIRQKINMADIVIDNRSTLSDTQKQTRMIIQRLLARRSNSRRNIDHGKV